MDNDRLIGMIKAAVENAESKGQKSIDTEALKHYLDSIKGSADVIDGIERQSHESRLAQFNAESTFNVEMFKSVLDSGKSAIQALMLICGGAVIAMLALVGNLANSPQGGVLAYRLATPLLLFGIGVIAAAFCFALRYFSQACFAESSGVDAWYAWGGRIRTLAIITGFIGYGSFLWGLIASYKAIQDVFAS